MKPVEKLTALQADGLEKIEKAHSNFKKSPKDRITLGYVQGRLESLEVYYREFKCVHEKIVTSVTNEEKDKLSYFSEDIFDSFEERYYTYKGELKTVLQILSTDSKDNHNPSGASTKPQHASSNEIKLPQITIPTFSGNYTEWQSFHDLFTTLIHNNPSLENVQKMHYLKVNLKGDADILLRQFSITGENYLQAWHILKKRYDSKRFIANCHFKRFFGQKTLINESASGLKQLLDTTVECLNALKNLGLPTAEWDAIVTYVVVSKMDPGTHKHWEELVNGDESTSFPSFEKLKSFLETRFRTLEMIEPINKVYKPTNSTQATKSFHVTDTDGSGGTECTCGGTRCLLTTCVFCKEQHYIFNCKQFAKQPIDDRYSFVQKNNLCFNCLNPNHAVWRCKQKSSCQICKRRHHSLLHRESKLVKDTQESEGTNTSEENSKVVAHVRPGEEEVGHNVLLATALVDVTSSYGQAQVCRTLIDQGSEVSFVTAQVVELLRLKKTAIDGKVSGIGGGNNVSIRNKVELQISSRYECDFSIKVNAYVLKSLTRSLPSREIDCNIWPQLDNMELADPTFNTPGRIDILLGADVFGKIISSGFMRGPGDVVAQHTHLGWILSGATNTASSRSHNITSFHVTRQVEEDNNLLKKFWEVETELYTTKKPWSKEEELCEEIYKTTTIRDEMGRYIVNLPLKQSVEDTVKLCGNTKQQAIVRFKQLERKLEKNEHLKKEYSKVIHEYLELDHMKKAESEDKDEAVYLPHHAVVREDRDTTKVRVVFDASAKGSNGASLNNAMMIGPTLQPGLKSLVIRWRAHKICVVADVVKMYRQVKMTDIHTDLQRIVWRDEPNEEIQSYKLLTVTFGTAAAPYLAVRTVSQLADDEALKYPRAASIVKNSFYMDDLMTGHEDESEVKKLCNEVNSLLKAGGFEMQKWSSNSEELLDYLRDGKPRDEPQNKIEIKLDSVIKILGLTWNRKEDNFKITVKLPESRTPVTKRQIISEVASLFDPFGWLAPVVITAKVMIQKLWLCSLGWDDELPPNIVEEWMNYRAELRELQTLEIPRWIGLTSRSKEVQLHGFADASSVAYAAMVYLRVVDEDDNVQVTLLASKTKVAPLKQLTIPRLELCAAVLAARLLRELSELLNITMDNIYAWTDSMVVLSWLQSQPSRWQVFVGNRVSDIIQQIDNDKWRHVQSADNPADLASRGVKPRDIVGNDMWWTGPRWLRDKDIEYERRSIPETALESKMSFHTTMDEPIWDRFSSMSKLRRVLAMCLRFLRYKEKENRVTYLQATELNEIEVRCIKYYQDSVYNKEIKDLKQNKRVKPSSSLISLTPYLDEEGLLRVGGRLNNAPISEYAKHPIIIPSHQHITKLLVKEAHFKTLHGDVQEMMTYIRSKYWIINLKSAVKKVTRTCKTCVIDKARTQQQLMGQLPTARVTPNRAFLNSGVDYAGPVQLKTSKGRGYKTIKGYICLFVCMSTRAIHLEAVTDLSAQAFIAAFKRFTGRRGHCAHLWSDNGSNFVGAAKELKEMFAKGKANLASEVAELLANDQTTWHFIPPRAPNFGGLWEAGVRSMKKHLNRVITDTTKLTYEEMSTLLVQIEACLNSRPLCKVDATLTARNPLTSGHFLIGEPIINVPDKNYEEQNVNMLTRWQFVQSRVQDFWRKWKAEYLNTLQQRYKWRDTVNSPCVGDIVVIKEDDTPPAKWLLGKITDLHPGKDNLVRVATVQCKGNHLLKRPLSKLVLLPNEQ